MPYTCRRCDLYSPSEFVCPRCHETALFDFHTEEELVAQGLRLTTTGQRVGAWDAGVQSAQTSSAGSTQPFFDGAGEPPPVTGYREMGGSQTAFFGGAEIPPPVIEPLPDEPYHRAPTRRPQRDIGFALRELFARARYHGVFHSLLYLAFIGAIIGGIAYLWSRRMVIFSGILQFISGILPTVIALWFMWVCLKNIIHPK